MATERQLRARIRSMEEALAAQEQQSRRIQQQITAQTQAQIRQLQVQTQQAFQQRLDETAEAYAQRVRQFQESVLLQNSRQLAELQREAEEVNRQKQAIMKEMEACSQELLAELRKLRSDTDRQTTMFRQAAQNAQNEALQVQKLVATTPHDFFFPQEFDIISSHIQDITSLIDMGMYQAAVSDANCIELEFKLLRTKVEQAFSEWMQAFQDYCAIVGVLYSQLQEFESRNLQTSAGSFCMKPQELDFWSCGTYRDMADKIHSAYHSFCTMDQDQILEYLRQKAGTNRRAIFDLVTQGKQWGDQLTAIMNCIVSERVFSDQRLTVAQDVADLLEDLNYQTDMNQFSPPEAMRLSQAWYIAGEEEDPLSNFDLHMVAGRHNRIKLHIVPRREHGLAVANLYFLSLDLTSATDSVTEQLVAQEILQNIHQVLQERNINAQVQFIPSAEDPESVIRKQELLLSPPPSAMAQMRHLERKYH